jgi:hypothetical protein
VEVGICLLLRFYDPHGLARLADQLIRHAAEDRSADARATVGRDGRHVDLLFFDRLKQFLASYSLAHLGGNFDSFTLAPLTQRIKVILSLFEFHSDRLIDDALYLARDPPMSLDAGTIERVSAAMSTTRTSVR